ncbi:hypothetical protein X777_01729 [Ooceraea biroi]|uniref:Uncharacterized protein n=1 Tax=Ooceraea biroi TaxID=2015173 RepID=A0A026WMI9_OOCBI|nr:hypothetical protein X777_01729 [Ooceraea biroi]
MAFMMPVVKNEWDIYKTNRSRRSSECSNPQACRSRKIKHFGVSSLMETEQNEEERSFVFYPVQKGCIIDRVKSKCLTSIGSAGGGRSSECRNGGERGEEGGESSCEFYANPVAGRNRLHRSVKSICADNASANGRDIVGAFSAVARDSYNVSFLHVDRIWSPDHYRR